MKSGMTLRRKISLMHNNAGLMKAQILDALMEMPDLLVIVTNTCFELQFANKYFYTCFHCAPSDLTGRALYIFLSDDLHHDMNEAHIKRVLDEKQVWGYDARTTLADGEAITIRWNQCVFDNPDGHTQILSVGIIRKDETVLAPDSLYAYPSPNGWDGLPASSAEGGGFYDRQGVHPDGHLYTVQAPGRLIPADGASGYSFPSPDNYSTAADIQNALDERAFTLYYLPMINTRSMKVIGAEALVRMNHPEQGILSADQFIGVAEQTGQIIPIGDYVIDATCKKIQRLVNAGLDITMSVNITTTQFMHEGFTETLLRAMTRYDVVSGRLTLEVNESIATQNPQKVYEIIKIVRGMGCQISLDNFGAYFSSLRYLENIDIDNLKIDRSFLATAMFNKRTYAIIESVITLAHGLGMTVTAVGVESQSLLEFLQDHYCDYIQGFLLSKPLPEKDFDSLVLGNSGIKRLYL